MMQCKQFLRILEAQRKLCFVRLNVSAVPIAGGTRFRRNPDMLGCPDLLVWVMGGPQLCIETKSEDGRLTPSQERFKERLERVGHKYYVVRSLDELTAVLRENGVLL